MRRTVVFLSIMTQGCGHSEDAIGEPGLDAGGSTLASGDGPALPTTGTGSEPTGDPPVTTTTTSSSSEGSGESSASTEPGPVCGDGIVEGDEGCDDGFSNNLPGNPCTDGCQPAACGDGSVQASNQEACDHGVFNVEMPGYEQCSTSCTRGPYCGDGVVQADAGEECEPGGREDEVKNCAGMCRHKPRILFITSTRHTGDLGGLAGADQICNKCAAQEDGLTGTYRAWLLVDGQSLADRFPEFMAPVAWNFTNTAAGLLAKDFAALVAMGPKQPIAFTEAGEPLAEELVWTGITADGVAAGGDCGQWTSEAGAPALVGHSGHVPNVGPEALKWQVERRWTDSGVKLTCHQQYPFYCLQVGD